MSNPATPDRREVLASIERRVRVRRRNDVAELTDVLAWADAHSGDPRDQPGAVPASHGGPRLVTVGGEGTPAVVDLCCAELAIARQAGVVATEHVMADALDLRHRLPLTWSGAQGLLCEVWVVRKVARLSRGLSRVAAGLVDAAVAAALHETPSRILTIAEAKVIETDAAAHRARLAANLARRAARLDEADALDLVRAVEDLADVVASETDHDPDAPPTRDQLRADALGMLGRPAEVLRLVDGAGGLDPASHVPRDPGPTGKDPAHVPGPAGTRGPRRVAILHVHLSSDAVAEADGSGAIARVEGVGPRLVDEVARLVRHHEIHLQQVLDLTQVHAVNGYEHPTLVRQRTEQRVRGDAFPHTTVASTATCGTRQVDHDHPVPYDRDGPPGQTGDLDDAPLTRRHHRAKTHLGYGTDQLALGTYRWRTPHGLGRVVTPSGARRVDLLTASESTVIGETYD
ncbi:hypothetical protein KUV85_05425 [Nocardioides panacisoli]|uniref:hypothetical protein n=1 Tax=Nocardioides panacisoli TaxID=627624 RepID=UPI001C630D33|nr:hypothetical protein [Nocardioides panacisoli]QYJ05128.1 hypothetical protein KUV85_05425 [Nocardioides panacisoli]